MFIGVVCCANHSTLSREIKGVVCCAHSGQGCSYCSLGLGLGLLFVFIGLACCANHSTLYHWIMGGSWFCSLGLGLFVVLIRVRVRVVVCVHWGSLLCESFYIVSWD